EHTLERVIWEDRIKAVMDLANLLVARGNTRVAIELCERLIAKYPNSQVAERCTQSIEEFRQGRRSVSLE
ncbi:MAG: tetratricopeptide repeat protein, partial [Candidatus Hydrogenedentes bacterium]|nr:tetratricopeptide repeat protein [Candidatus Hydrogenedentota bacterium]